MHISGLIIHTTPGGTMDLGGITIRVGGVILTGGKGFLDERSELPKGDFMPLFGGGGLRKAA